MSYLFIIIPVIVAAVCGWIAGRSGVRGDYWAGIAEGWSQGVARIQRQVEERGNPSPTGQRLIRPNIRPLADDEGILLCYVPDNMARLRLEMARQAQRMQLPSQRGGHGA